MGRWYWLANWNKGLSVADQRKKHMKDRLMRHRNLYPTDKMLK